MIRSASRGDAPRGAALPLVVTDAGEGCAAGTSGAVGGTGAAACNNRPMADDGGHDGDGGAGSGVRAGPAAPSARSGLAPAGGSRRRARRRIRLPPGTRRRRLADGGARPPTPATGDHLYVHGSVASRSLRTAVGPAPVCVTVTLVDGLVLARSVFNHSVNYRCAMVYGLPELVDDPAEKLAGARGHQRARRARAVGLRPDPSAKELAADHACCGSPSTRPRSRSAPGRPTTRTRTSALDVWAGEVPLRTVRLDPVPAPDLAGGIGPARPHRHAGRSGPGRCRRATSADGDAASGRRVGPARRRLRR